MLMPAVPAALVELGRTRAAARRLNRQLDAEPAVHAPADASRPPGVQSPGLALEGVTFRHGAAADAVLQDLSLAIAAGEVVAVVGPSGAGKSTLGDLAARVVDPADGRVRLAGVDVARLRPVDRVARIGYLTQRSELFADSIAGNLRIARPGAPPAALWAALAVAGLDDFVHARDAGLDARVGQAGMRLSGGQARRLALARVVLADTPVVVLDEPLAGLDRDTARRVADGLERWFRGRSVLLLGHDASVLPRADRYLRLEGGGVVPASGPGIARAGRDDGRLDDGAGGLWRNGPGAPPGGRWS